MKIMFSFAGLAAICGIIYWLIGDRNNFFGVIATVAVFLTAATFVAFLISLIVSSAKGRQGIFKLRHYPKFLCRIYK